MFISKDNILDFTILSSIHNVFIKPLEKIELLVKKKEFSKTLRRLALNDESKIYNINKFIEMGLLEKFNINKSKYKLNNQEREENEVFALISLYLLNYGELNFINYPSFCLIYNLTKKQNEEIKPYIKRWYPELEIALIWRNLLKELVKNNDLFKTDPDDLNLFKLHLYKKVFQNETSSSSLSEKLMALEKRILENPIFIKSLQDYQNRISLSEEVKANPKHIYKNHHIKNKPNYLFEYQKRRKSHEN